MNHQLGGRNQKPKGFKVKHAIQVTIVLVLGIWLLCQIKNSYFNPLEKKLKDGSIDLGRKSNAGMNEGKPMIQIRNEEDGENGDDELDRKVEEEVSQLEASVKEVLTREAKKEEELENKEKEILHKEEDRPSNSDDRNGEVESENDQERHKEMTEEKVMGEDATDDEEKDPKELQSVVEVNTELQNSEEDEESNEKAEETESSNGGDSFNDQNGIPPDSLNLQDAAIKGITNDSLARRMDEETVLLNSNNPTEHGTNTSTISQNETEVLEFGDSSGTSTVKSSENNSEVDTNDHEEAEEVLEAEDAEKLEKSRINGAEELTQEDSLVLEESDSVLSQHEVEERF